MFSFIVNDIEFIKKILKYLQDINQKDNNNKNAIIYSVLEHYTLTSQFFKTSFTVVWTFY